MSGSKKVLSNKQKVELVFLFLIVPNINLFLYQY